jgi:hypothetical protein
MRYRTEIVIPSDRYVCVQLPAYLPEGRAIVTIVSDESELDEPQSPADHELDRVDIEWWDEPEEE